MPEEKCYMDENRVGCMWGVSKQTGGKRTERKYAVSDYPRALSK